MKKINYFLFPIVPVLIGYLYSSVFLGILGIPLLGSLFFYALPYGMLILWFWVGRKYAQAKIPALSAVLIGNSFGILLLLLYIWQFVYLSDQQRNLSLAAFSQCFSVSISFLTAKVAILFEPRSDEVGFVTMFGIQIIGLLVMVLTFALGFYTISRSKE